MRITDIILGILGDSSIFWTIFVILEGLGGGGDVCSLE
jgi:hypothetical protein